MLDAVPYSSVNNLVVLEICPFAGTINEIILVPLLKRDKSYIHYYRPQRSCGQGNVFTGVCLSTGGGRPGRPPEGPGRPPPGPGRHPPDQADPPRDQADPPGTRQTPPRTRQTPPGPGRPPPGKQTPPYGLRAAGTHPTGMHSCFNCVIRNGQRQKGHRKLSI